MVMRKNFAGYLCLTLAVALSGCAIRKLSAGNSDAKSVRREGVNSSLSRFRKVMIVFYENQGYSKVAEQPFFNWFASKGALLTNFHASFHPSQPNYIGLVAGDNLGVEDDESHDLNGASIADLLEARGKTWKNYAEGYPGGCFKGQSRGRYVRKHTPFISFKSIQRDPERCKNIVSAEQLDKDIAEGTLPNFSIYTPDMDDDGHDRGLDFADRAFKKTFEPLLKNQEFMKDMLFIVTFDEDDKKENNRIYTVLYGPSVKTGAKSADKLNHYSLLKLVEDEWGLGDLGRNDRSAKPVEGVWAD